MSDVCVIVVIFWALFVFFFVLSLFVYGSDCDCLVILCFRVLYMYILVDLVWLERLISEMTYSLTHSLDCRLGQIYVTRKFKYFVTEHLVMGAHRHGQEGALALSWKSWKVLWRKKNSISEVSLNGGEAAFPRRKTVNGCSTTTNFHFCIGLL